MNKNNTQFSAYDEFNNGELLIARGCRYSLNDYKTLLNNNVLVVGGSGTGKTRYIVTPNLLEAVGSYIVSDPKGNLRRKHSDYLEKHGYKIINVDFTHPEASMHYNPLMCIRNTQDILKISYMLIDEKATRASNSDPYWDNITTMFMASLIAYLVETGSKSLNFSEILKLAREGEREDDDSKKSALSERFLRLKNANPDSWACQQFENVNAAPYKTYDCIRSTLAAKFSKLDTRELRMMMSGTDIDFEAIGREKTAVFVTVSDTDRSMDALVNIFFTQAMQMLCDYADNKCSDCRLPVPVRFFLDDFATNCRIDEFPRMISSIRSRAISVMLMIQAEAQLLHGYGNDGYTIMSNCDTYAYLGGNDLSTARAVSERCDKPLKQILSMAIGDCWIFRRGEPPVFSRLLPPKALTPERGL